MMILSGYTIGRTALVTVFTLYMFYLGLMARPVHKDHSTLCRVMHGLSVMLCAIGALTACATL